MYYEEQQEPVVQEDDQSLQHPLVRQMVIQLRAVDSYGTYDTWSDARVLDPLVLTKERRKAIPVVGDPDETTISRVKAYYNALAQLIERETGLLAVPVINITHEGFGRALILVGKLVALDKVLRDVHRFGFDSLEALVAEAQKQLAKATALVGEHRAVAEL
ncbi:probable nitrogen fixation protein [Azotobacter beijerinckii]|uniref:Probable nitrogen fixation protein n=1 Tax=Azotobacter beijerinckii TaxID=170623 RepID=A0A1H6U7M5_9GAMM|nr:NifX-associated nitrogen fixation protein [Azotobacter beijerinckii]SEI88349.1 probable nitrogen fixation protein [Azotobacter beijerinckii]SEI93271.1 probable nitrogen fixation protein [Azotobacter beijerinckii]SEP76970.1 probable nitrogen fixation protein [Azotobacter beijerinckii]SFB09334.1 probable nitrogen fixation protein [Azotobacter beijerinckii]SFK71261.1 probable nitrogen fixation protein [Azotobacter beijerinckii]